jgi:hypothetical protein
MNADERRCTWRGIETLRGLPEMMFARRGAAQERINARNPVENCVQLSRSAFILFYPRSSAVFLLR